MSNHVDFETRSALNLKVTGLHIYARHSSTTVLCLAFSLDSGETVETWRQGDPPPEKLLAAVQRGETFWAHNASFEDAIWHHVCVNKFGWPPVAKWDCTMRMCAYAGLPLSLDKASEWLELEVQKDRGGKALMTKMSQAKNAKNDNEEKWQKLISYCATDVKVEAAVHRIIAPLKSVHRVAKLEEKMVGVDREINDRGVPIDSDTCRAIVKVLEVEKQRLNTELSVLTGGEITSGQQSKKLVAWLNQRNMPIDNVRKDTVAAAVKVADRPDVKRALEIRQATSQGSTAKLAAMLQGIDGDGRMRGLFQHYGASQTGRWAGRRIQLQNLPRLNTTDTMLSAAVQAFHNIDPVMLEMIFGDCVSAAKQMIRPLIRVPGGLVVADYAQIELRVAAWLSNETRLLDIFSSGADAYIGMAGKIFGKPDREVDKKERFVGKVAMLGCQYQMGPTRFAEQLASFGVPGTDKELVDLAAMSVPAFRDLHPNIKRLWWHLTNGAIQAFTENRRIRVGKLDFMRIPGTDTLLMILPSGRPLHYWFVKAEEGKYGPSLTHKAVRENKIVRAGLYGGRWLENAAQGIARDLLAAGIIKLSDMGQKVIGHVHDEVLVEEGDKALVEKALTEDLPAWASGLPVEVEAFNCIRYTK